MQWPSFFCISSNNWQNFVNDSTKYAFLVMFYRLEKFSLKLGKYKHFDAIKTMLNDSYNDFIAALRSTDWVNWRCNCIQQLNLLLGKYISLFLLLNAGCLFVCQFFHSFEKKNISVLIQGANGQMKRLTCFGQRLHNFAMIWIKLVCESKGGPCKSFHLFYEWKKNHLFISNFNDWTVEFNSILDHKLSKHWRKKHSKKRASQWNKFHWCNQRHKHQQNPHPKPST